MSAISASMFTPTTARVVSSVRKTSSKSSRKSSLIVVKAAAEAKPDPGSDPKGLGNALPMEMDIDAIMKLLPHRYPFLLVDRILEIEQGSYAIGAKNVTINEPYIQGHFPGHPIMPGVLQLEAMAQAAGILMLKEADNAGKIAYFMAADKVKWRKPVKPGDVLQIDIEVIKARGKICKAKGVCSVGGETVSEAEIALSLIHISEPTRPY